jgi:predicted HicB family RNase H-like nuclease
MNVKPETRCSVLVRVDPTLKHAIVREVERRDTSMNDLLVGALAKHYDASFRPSGKRRRMPKPDKGTIVLRMSDELKRKIQFDALRGRSNLMQTIHQILCDIFDVQVELAPSRRKTPFGGRIR